MSIPSGSASHPGSSPPGLSVEFNNHGSKSSWSGSSNSSKRDGREKRCKREIKSLYLCQTMTTSNCVKEHNNPSKCLANIPPLYPYK